MAGAVAADGSPVNPRNDHMVRDDEPNQAVYVGIAFLWLGAVALGAYIVKTIPTEVVCSLLCIALGAGILVAQLRVHDRVFFGKSMADFIVTHLKQAKQFQQFTSALVVLSALPDPQAEDVELVFQLRPSTDHDVLPETEKLVATSSLHSKSKEEDCVCSSSDAFEVASRWLRRPHLALGFTDQLWLHSLMLQAKVGDAYELPPAKATEISMLAEVKHQGWHALRGLSSSVARERLPLALAEVDPGFVSAHPHLKLLRRRAAGRTLMATVLQMVARRLPADLDARIACGEQRLLSISAVGTVFALLTNVWNVRRSQLRSRRGLLLPCAAVASSATTLFLAAVVHGLPAWLQAALVLRLYGERGIAKLFAARTSAQLGVESVVCSQLASVLTPRVACSIFAD